jgi:hypothetical protein
MSLALAEPRVLSDATEVLANMAAYAHRPTLIHLARLVALTAANTTPAQRRTATAQIGGAV